VYEVGTVAGAFAAGSVGASDFFVAGVGASASSAFGAHRDFCILAVLWYEYGSEWYSGNVW
jgi:hypothetical protein